MDCYGLLWITTDCYGLPRIAEDYHGLHSRCNDVRPLRRVCFTKVYQTCTVSKGDYFNIVSPTKQNGLMHMFHITQPIFSPISKTVISHLSHVFLVYRVTFLEIFYRCDLNGKGYSSQAEFNEFQVVRVVMMMLKKLSKASIFFILFFFI